MMVSRLFRFLCLSIILLLQTDVIQSLTCYCSACQPSDECTGFSCYLRVHRASNMIMEEYGCFEESIFDPTHGICNQNKELRFYCCDDIDYCNRNFTSNVSDTISSSFETTPSPTLSTDPTAGPVSLYVIIPVTIIATCCLGLVPCIVILFVIGKLVKKGGRDNHGKRRVHNTSNHIAKLNGHHNNHHPDYLPSAPAPPCSSTSMEPVHVSLSNEPSFSSSGSGAGIPFLVKRTIARSITLGEPIGSGRFGQVYVGYYQGERYAVKKFFSKDEASWFHESDIYNTFNLRHENILTCFATDMLSNNGATELWLITQYYSRGSLYEELNRNSLTPESTLKVLISVCRGLIYLHTELAGTQGKPSIAHRDIKSKNILVKNDTTCCIADFGMAIVNDNTFSTFKDVKEIQQGTKRYMPPEVLAGTVNVKLFESFLRGDVYCFGLVMWEVARRCRVSEEIVELEYCLPFHSLVPHDPSIEEMKEIIIDKQMIPEIPSNWNYNQLHQGLIKQITDCCYRDPAERPTALYIRKKLDKLADICEIKLNMS